MSNSRIQATAKNFVITIMYQLLTIAFGFIIPRLFLETYGVAIHGLTSTITNIMAYVLLLNAGLGTASIQALYSPLGNKNTEKINSVINAVDNFYKKVGISYSIAVFIIAFVLPYVVGGEVSWRIVFALMLVMGLTSILECFIYSKYRVLLLADQKLYIISLVNIFALFLRGMLQIILIKNNVSVVIVQFISVAMVLVRMLLLSSYVRKNYPYLNKKVEPDIGALSKRWSAFAHQIAGIVVNNTDVILLTIFGNLTLVSIYSVYQLVFSQLYRMMTTIFSQASVASFGQLISLNDSKAVNRNYNKYEFFYYMSISVIYSVCAVMILSFVGLYTIKVQNVQYIDVKLAVLFVVIGIANNLRVPGGTLINASGLYKETQWRAILEATINIVLSLILVQFLGIYGILIGTIASFAYRTTDIILFSNKIVLKKSPRITISRACRVVAVVCVNVLIFNIGLNLFAVNWFQWFWKAIFVAFSSVIITFVMNFVLEPSTLREVIFTVRNIFSNHKIT